MKTTNVQFVRKSGNAKIGKIPCTTSPRSTCPEACPLSGDKGACYAESGYYTKLNWNHVDNGSRGDSFAALCESIAKLPANQLWRHNVAGDLQGSDNRIDGDALRQLTQANKGKRGFTYTHYPVLGNRLKIQTANANGFTVNISANTIGDAAAIKNKYPLLPVVTIMSEDLPKTMRVDGQTIVTCPATYKDDVTCDSCQLCQVSDRAVIVGFPVHGARKASADIIARG